MSAGVDWGLNYESLVEILQLPVSVVGMIFNILVILCICSDRMLAKTTLLLLSLALSDLGLLCTGCYIRYYGRVGLGSQFSCKFFNAGDIVFLHVSAYTIATIAFQRYLRVICPSLDNQELEYRPELGLSLFIWIIGIVTSLPVFVHGGFAGNNCINDMQSEIRQFYFLGIFLTSFVIPGIMISYFYIMLLKANSEMIISQADRVEQAEIIRMLMLLIIIFWVFHIPFWYIFLRWIFLNEPTGHFSLAVSCTYLAATLDPLCYFFVNTKYYEALVSSFHAKFPCGNKLNNSCEVIEDQNFATIPH